MFYRGRHGIKAPVRRNFKINAFGGYRTGIAENLIDLAQSKYCFNVSANDGELRPGYGTLSAQIVGSAEGGYVLAQPNEPIDGAWYYKRFDQEGGIRDDRLIVRTVTDKLLSLKITQKASEYVFIGEGYGKVYTAQCYRIGDVDVLLLSTDKGLYKLDGDVLTKIEKTPEIKDVCIHFERAFATVQGEGISLWFSKSLDPTDWTVGSESGGYMDFADNGGKLTKLISFMGYLYVFREYSIERVSALAEQTEFAVRKVYSSTDRIFEKTVAVCGDCMIFLSETGLYRFDGANVTKLSVISQEELGIFGNSAVGAYFRGVYFLGCYLERFEEEKTNTKRADFIENNCLLLYDLDSGKTQIIMDHDVSGFLSVQTENTGELLFWINPDLQEYVKLGSIQERRNVRLGRACEAYWRTGLTDLGYPEKRKFLRSVTVNCEGKVNVGVILDGEKTDLGEVTGVGVRLHVNKPFSKFGLYFSSTAKTFKIGNPVITVDMR